MNTYIYDILTYLARLIKSSITIIIYMCYIYHNQRKKLIFYNRSVRNKFKVIWCKILSFFGGTPSEKVDKSKYERLTMSIKQTVLERAHHRCQKCSTKFSASIHPQFEHISGSLKDNRPANLRALCPECFKLVAKKENRKGMIGTVRDTFKGILKKWKLAL